MTTLTCNTRLLVLLMLLASTLVDAHSNFTYAIVGGVPTNWTQTEDGPSARASHATASLGNGKALMYGGCSTWKDCITAENRTSEHFNDAFIFSLSPNETTSEKETGTWTKTGDGPSARIGHAMASLGNGKALMYGGNEGGSKEPIALSDASIFALSTNEKTGEETGTWTKIADGPSKRTNHAMSLLGNGKVLMHGGYDGNNILNDAFIFSISTNGTSGEETGTWAPTTDGPSARIGHAMSSLGNGKVLMYGGTNQNGTLNDAFIFALSINETTGDETGTWTPTADGPSARDAHAMSSLGNGKILMYGGMEGETHYLNDASIFLLSTNEKTGEETGTWTPTAGGPSARVFHAMSSLENGNVFMYGGLSQTATYSFTLNDAWINGPPSPPPPICCQAKTADPQYKDLCMKTTDKSTCLNSTSGYGNVCNWTCGECDATKGSPQFQKFCLQHDTVHSCNSVNQTCAWVPSSFIFKMNA